MLGQRRGWWQPDGVLLRWLTDFVAGHAAKLRPGFPLPGNSWEASLALGSGGLGLDSLERLHVATALSAALQMQHGGVADGLLAGSTLGDWARTAEQSLQRHCATLAFHSSGSTGEPKLAQHALAALEDEAAAQAALLGGGVRRVLSAVPCHHIYGFLFTVLLPRELGSPPVTDLRRHSAAALGGMLRAGDVVVGYPEFWAAAAHAPARWPAGVVGVSSAGPLPDAVAEAALGCGLERLLQVHGSSETAGLGTREAAGAPYTLLPAWQRTPQDGLMRGGLAVEPPDRMEWVGERTYRLLGRRDGVVQVGGVNVSPGRVEAALRRHPAVAAASVRLMRPGEGARLKAFVVPADPAADPAALQAALHVFVGDCLAAPEQPRAYAFGPALPVDALGKAADWPVGTEEAPARWVR